MASLSAAAPPLTRTYTAAPAGLALLAKWLLRLLPVAVIAGLVGALDWYYLAGAVGAGLVATVIAIRPRAAIVLLIFSVPFGSIVQVDLGGISVGATEPLVALLGLSWAAAGIRRHSLVVRGGPILAAALAFFGLALFSVTYALSMPEAAKETLKWLQLILAIVIVSDLVRDRGQVAFMLGALFVAAGSEALWGIAQAVTNSGPAVFLLGGALRAFGHFEQPNPFAGYLSTVVPLAVAFALAPIPERRLRLLAGGAALAMSFGVLLSQSRGAWIGLSLSLLAILLAWSPRSRRLLFPAVVGMLLVISLAAAGFLPGQLVDRVVQTLEYFGIFDVRTVELTSENWAVVERMAHWQAGWYMFLDHPLLGVGAGNYAAAYPNYYLNDWLDPLGHAHNYYLNTMAELGLVGLTILLAFLGLTFRFLLRNIAASYAVNTPEAVFWRAILVGVFGGLLVFCIHNLFDNLFVHSVNWQIGFFIALALVAAHHLHALRAPGSVRA